MGALGVAEPQRVGEGVEQRIRGDDPALLDAAQVVRAEAGQRGELLAAQPRHAAAGAALDADLARLQMVAPEADEGAQLGVSRHAVSAYLCRRCSCLGRFSPGWIRPVSAPGWPSR